MPSLLASNVPGGTVPRKRSINNRSAEEPFMKRRKTTTGLNSRFDRMIETVNILHTSPTSSKSSRSGGRRRAASSSSASAVEFEMPRTPVDAYSPGGRLGPDFVVMKMRDSESSVDLGFSGRYAFETPSSCDSPSIPAWLSNTLSTLDTHHPLRRLMYMDSTSHEVAPAATLESHVEPVDVPYHAPPAEQVADHEPIFAFNAPRGPAAEATARAIDAGPPASDRLVDSTEHGALLGPLELPFVSPHCSPILDGSMFTESPLVPFSTPGPASSVSAIPPSVFSLGSVRRSTNSFLASLHEANIAEQSGHEQHDYAFAAPTSSIASVQPASLIVAAANTGGDPFGVPPGNHEDPLLSIPPQLPDRGHALRMHYTASEYHDYMRAAGGAVQQTPSPTLDDVMLPSMWRSAMQTGMGLSPIQRTTKSNTPQPRTEGWDIPQTPGLVDATPVRSVSARPVRIYFDSPAEDPCSSDALDVESYVLPDDPASLDFKWEKFDRGRVGGTHTPDSSSDGIDPSVVATHRTPSVPEEQWVPRTPVLVTAYSSSSSGIPHLDKQPSEDNDDGTWIIPMPAASALSGASYPSRGHKAASGRIAESVCQPLQSVFAPAPGVSISPLRKTGEDDDNPSPEPRHKAGGKLQTPVREHNSLQSSPCERTQRRIRASHGQTPTASEQPVVLPAHDAGIERGVYRASLDVKMPRRSPSVPAAASELDRIAAAAMAKGDGHHSDPIQNDDVSDDGHMSACSQESHDTIELWSE